MVISGQTLGDSLAGPQRESAFSGRAPVVCQDGGCGFACSYHRAWWPSARQCQYQPAVGHAWLAPQQQPRENLASSCTFHDQAVGSLRCKSSWARRVVTSRVAFCRHTIAASDASTVEQPWWRQEWPWRCLAYHQATSTMGAGVIEDPLWHQALKSWSSPSRVSASSTKLAAVLSCP